MKYNETTQEYLNSIIGHKVRIATETQTYEGVLAFAGDVIKVVGEGSFEISVNNIKDITVLWLEKI